MTDARTEARPKKRPPRTKLQQAWHDMRRRCYDPRHNRYTRYGARGISICDEWRDNFEAFKEWSLRNGFADGLSIDRYPDNDGNYEPSNCRWATQAQQFDTRSATAKITYRGETLTLRRWEDRTGIVSTLLWDRICRAGWDVERALNTPPMTRQQAGAQSAKARRAA